MKGNKSESEKIMDKEQVGSALVEDDKEDSQSVLNEVCTIILLMLSYTLWHTLMIILCYDFHLSNRYQINVVITDC